MLENSVVQPEGRGSDGRSVAATKYQITVRMLIDRYTAVVRGEMPPDALPNWLAGTFRAVLEYIRVNDVAPTGPPFVRFAFLGGDVAAEAGFPVRREVAGEASVEPSTLPGGHDVVVPYRVS